MKGHQPRRRFGQNFLADPHYIAQIVAAVDPRPSDNLVEIGPGLAALTQQLIERTSHITAIEIDRDLAARLQQTFTSEQLTLHIADALRFDFATLGAHLRIVGNLPYNISTPLLFHLFQFEANLDDLRIMLQKEVIARMIAAPDTPEYGRLSVTVQARFAVKRLFTVPPGAFRPAPKIESAVARLTPLREAKPRIDDETVFAQVVAAAFGQRRKTLRNALSMLCDAATLEAAGIAPGARGETLSVADFVRLANRVTASHALHQI
jgi:16S rRNA (adenine1518-N6/adenine1519-N6)-dimethyltransferase